MKVIGPGGRSFVQQLAAVGEEIVADEVVGIDVPVLVAMVETDDQSWRHPFVHIEADRDIRRQKRFRRRSCRVHLENHGKIVLAVTTEHAETADERLVRTGSLRLKLFYGHPGKTALADLEDMGITGSNREPLVLHPGTVYAHRALLDHAE